MGSRTVFYDDLTQEENTSITKRQFQVEGEDVELELSNVTFEALSALLKGKNPAPIRAVFAPATTNGGRRSHEEIEHIRAVARAALNPDGTPMFADIKNTGRIRNDVEQWFENVYTPAQNNTETQPETVEAQPEVAADAAEETPTRRGGRRS